MVSNFLYLAFLLYYKIFLYQYIQKHVILFNDCVVFQCINVLYMFKHFTIAKPYCSEHTILVHIMRLYWRFIPSNRIAGSKGVFLFIAVVIAKLFFRNLCPVTVPHIINKNIFFTRPVPALGTKLIKISSSESD